MFGLAPQCLLTSTSPSCLHSPNTSIDSPAEGEREKNIGNSLLGKFRELHSSDSSSVTSSNWKQKQTAFRGEFQQNSSLRAETELPDPVFFAQPRPSWDCWALKMVSKFQTRERLRARFSFGESGHMSLEVYGAASTCSSREFGLVCQFIKALD